MPAKKGVTPARVKESKEFSHPESEQPFIKTLEEVVDPRGTSLFLRHSLISILFMIIVAHICVQPTGPK